MKSAILLIGDLRDASSYFMFINLRRMTHHHWRRSHQWKWPHHMWRSHHRRITNHGLRRHHHGLGRKTSRIDKLRGYIWNSCYLFYKVLIFSIPFAILWFDFNICNFFNTVLIKLSLAIIFLRHLITLFILVFIFLFL